MAYSLDDVLLEPRFSSVESRLDTRLNTYLTTTIPLKIPVMATNMSTVTEVDMMKAMSKLGGVGALHRFLQPHQIIEYIHQARQKRVNPIVTSIGVSDEDYVLAQQLIRFGVDAMLIDVAHGHSNSVTKQLVRLREYSSNSQYIVGNIATREAAASFIALGANGLRVGIGPGSRCTTRQVTGHGVPNLTALLNVVEFRNEYYKDTETYIPVILDGGLRNSGDIVKALYFGADVCCFGKLFAGTTETPGRITHTETGLYKKYYGMASKEAHEIHNKGKTGIAPEGFSAPIPFKGSVKPIVEELVAGVRSGLSYSGARNIRELRENGRPMLLSYAAQTESKLR